MSKSKDSLMEVLISFSLRPSSTHSMLGLPYLHTKTFSKTQV